MANLRKISVLLCAVIALLGACFFAACSAKTDNGAENENAERNESYSFAISKTELNLEVGESERLECRYGDKKIVFSTSDEKVATVSENGTVTAVSAGVAYITAKAEGADNAEKMCKVTVIKSDYSVKIDREAVITAVIKDASVMLDFTATVYRNGEKTSFIAKFSVSPAGCETINYGNTARITFSSVGTYVVRAEYGNASVSVTVNVVDSIGE